MRFSKVRRGAVLAGGVAVLLVGVQAAIAAITSPATTTVGGAVTRVWTTREGVFATNTSAAWTTLTTRSVNVPSNQKGLFIARFSGESRCIDTDGDTSAAGTHCRMRILIGSVEMEPSSGDDFSFDSVTMNDANEDSEESHAFERSLGTFNPGTFTVVVQWRVQTTGATFVLDDWHLTIERVKVA